MPATPAEAAAVLRAETDLSVHLRDVLRGGPARAAAAQAPVDAAAEALVSAAASLIAPGRVADDARDIRDLQRLARAIGPCLEFLEALPSHAAPDPSPAARAAAACACAVAAFARLRAGAFPARVAGALVCFLREAATGKEEQWRVALLEAAPVIIPALHDTLEDTPVPARDVVWHRLEDMLALASLYLDVAISAKGPVANGAVALLEVFAAVVDQAQGGREEKRPDPKVSPLIDELVRKERMLERGTTIFTDMRTRLFPLPS